MNSYQKRIEKKIEKVKQIYGIFSLKGIGPKTAPLLIKKGININNFSEKKKEILKIRGIGQAKFKNVVKGISDIKRKLNRLFSYDRKEKSPPTSSFSNFVTNRKQGDWAENIIHSSLKNCIHYGRYEEPLPEDEGFEEYWLSYQKELNLIGKRPDLLIFNDISVQKLKELKQEISSDYLSEKVKTAKAGLEVRSSSYIVKEDNFVSITPKLEDLILVAQWIKTFGVKHYYLQVFFNKAYLISFEKILDIIINFNNIGKKSERNAKIKNYELSREAKNQFKHTYYIDSRFSKFIGEVEFPKLEANFIERNDGKITLYTDFEAPKNYSSQINGSNKSDEKTNEFLISELKTQINNEVVLEYINNH